MRIFRRLTDLLNANLHELIEQFENPTVMLKQIIREMDSAIQESLVRAVKVIVCEKLLTRELAEHESQASRWRQRVEDAVRQNDDSEARRVLAEKQLCERTLSVLARQRRECAESATRLRQYIDVLRRRVAEARRQQTLLAARQYATQTKAHWVSEFACLREREATFEKFERFRRQIEQAEAEAEAEEMAEFAEFDRLARPDAHDDSPESAQLEVELVALKSRWQP